MAGCRRPRRFLLSASGWLVVRFPVRLASPCWVTSGDSDGCSSAIVAPYRRVSIGCEAKPVAKMLLTAHNGRTGHDSGGAFDRRVGEPQVEQRGVIAQVTADVFEQVVAQQLGQSLARPRPGAESRGALGERIGTAAVVVRLANAVGVKQHAV